MLLLCELPNKSSQYIFSLLSINSTRRMVSLIHMQGDIKLVIIV
jgi:hypothetical protein